MSAPVILLVEDDPDDLEVVVRAIKDSCDQCQLRVARDGDEAVRMLFEETPNLVLLDLSLPKVGGHEVLRRAKADPRTKRVPIVILSTSHADVDVERACDLCANSYVLKPSDYGQYSRIIEEVTRYWLHVNHPARAEVAG